MMGMELISDIMESQSVGLKNVIKCQTNSLIASVIKFNR